MTLLQINIEDSRNTINIIVKIVLSFNVLLRLAPHFTRHVKGGFSSMFANLRAKRSCLSLSHFRKCGSYHPIEFLYVISLAFTRCSDQYVFITCTV